MSNKNIYLLLGPEEGEKREYIRKHVATLTKELGEKPEIHRHYAFDARIIDLVALLRNDSLFAQHTVLIIYNTEVIKKTDELAVLADYLESPSDSATLFLVADNAQQVSKKITDRIPQDNKVMFWELFENRKRQFVTDFFAERSIRIEADALDLLLEMVENNTRDLRNICSNLALFFGPDTVIKDDELEKYLYHSKEENVFTLFEKIAARDFPASIEILAKILSSGDNEGVALLAGLLWQARRVLSYKLLDRDNFHPDEICKKLNINGKKNRQIYSTAHSRYSYNEIVAIITLIPEFDIGLKSVKTELHTLLLQLLIYYIVKKGGVRNRIDDKIF